MEPKSPNPTTPPSPLPEPAESNSMATTPSPSSADPAAQSAAVKAALADLSNDDSAATPAPQSATPAQSSPSSTPSAEQSSPSLQNSHPAQPTQSPLSAPSTSPVSPQASKTPHIKNPNAKSLTSDWKFWGMIGAGVLAVIGIGLGVFGMVEKEQAEQKVEQLQQELDEANALVAKYGAQLGEITNQLGKPGNVDNDNSDAELDNILDGLSDATKRYIYIGEWGIKLKIPAELKNISYTFNNDLAQSVDGYTSGASGICVSGILKSMEYTPDAFLMDNVRPGFGCLTRFTKEDMVKQQLLSEEEATEDYYYVYSSPQATRGTTDEEKAQELEIIQLIQTMLSPEDLATFKNN